MTNDPGKLAIINSLVNAFEEADESDVDKAILRKMKQVQKTCHEAIKELDSIIINLEEK